MSNDEKGIWSTNEGLVLAANESQPSSLVAYAGSSLSKRDVNAIVSAFDSESYEMVASFVWSKSAAALKKQLANLGMEFVGEMLGRPDLNEDSDPSLIADHEVLSLAEDIGMITPTQGLRLKHALQLVGHYAQIGNQADDEPMERTEAVSILKVCVAAILSQPEFTRVSGFAEFRQKLSGVSIKEDDSDLPGLINGPYFFVRTTLSVLLAMAKSLKGAQLEHATGNIAVVLPLIWDRLKHTERWQVGQAYAEVSTAGNRVATSALKRALIAVHGFDFVPESLRSNSFTEAAARVLSAHFGFNNFYNEEEPMKVLANLGTSIPAPAIPKCMEATLAVWLGNRYGHSFQASDPAAKLLKDLRSEQWSYYLNHCLAGDRTILDKLSEEESPVRRWKELCLTYIPNECAITNKSVRELVDVSRSTAPATANVKAKAKTMREQIRS